MSARETTVGAQVAAELVFASIVWGVLGLCVLTRSGWWLLLIVGATAAFGVWPGWDSRPRRPGE